MLFYPGLAFAHLGAQLGFVELTNRAPEFVALLVEEDKCGGGLETVKRSQFHARFFLNVQADENQPVCVLFFEPVHDRLCGGAANSVWTLEFKYDRFALPDHGTHAGGFTHERSLHRADGKVHNHQSGQDGGKGEKFWQAVFFAKQCRGDKDEQYYSSPQNGIRDKDIQGTSCSGSEYDNIYDIPV
jgi:hypothetical protein